MMSIQDAESRPSFEYFCIQYTYQKTNYTEPLLTGPIYHRDSFDIYQENRARKNGGRRRIISLDDDNSEGYEKLEETSPVNQLIIKARQVWSTLPWSAAARERRKNRSRSSSNASLGQDSSSAPDEKVSESKSHKSKHTRFAN